MADRASARADGKAVFVPFTLPGETVEAEIVADKGGFSTAELQSVLEPSPSAHPASLPLLWPMRWLSLSARDRRAQVEMKRAILRENLERARIREIPEIEAITANPRLPQSDSPPYPGRIRSLSVTNSANRTPISPLPPAPSPPSRCSAPSKPSAAKGKLSDSPHL